MIKYIIILFALPTIIFAQNKKTNFYSDYQFDVTYDGTKLEGNKKVNIVFSDPKKITKEGMQFDELPKGFLSIKFEGLNKIEETIIYIKKISNQDIYSITNSETGNDIIYVIKETHKARKKIYSHIILLGKANENNIGGLPKYFTAFHCNIVK
jgi:hypothetical protein